ncbi:MAG: filamentous hemagglutinin N-terminal domain-containing protein, partial [Candidatus Omnitrophica bacterium]|nr:filamentous hemagglutinin N-terminal domain-containing protein [Candidatus Omnitrophota bacterium]
MRYLKYFSDIFLIVCLFLNISLFADALPQGESVVSGNAQFDSSQQNSLQVTVSDKAIINYDSFSIASSESVNFIQPSSSSIVLNRVIGIDPSEIFGSLSANGRIFLLNPNGILFGSGSRIDVSGLLASTLDIADDGFLSGAYNFKEGTGSSYIINKGVINAENGFVVLQSPLVSNEGVITATVGDVVVAGTTRSEVVFDGDGLISFVVPKIQDVLGDILIPQEYASSLIQGIVNTPAIIEAGQVIEEDGIIKLVGVSGLAVNDGIINVNGSSGHDAGSILITSGQASVINEGSLISANGIGENSSGGQIQILSEGISAVGPRATLEVRGGEISGNGGFVEVSGQDFMVDPLALFHLGAVYGTNGLFLLDPNNVTIRNNASSNTNMDVSTSTWFTTTDSAVVDVGLLAIALQSGNITIQTRSGLPTAPQAGNINVINSIDINNANGNQLILQAHNNITLDAAVFTDSNLATNDAVSLTLTADRDTSGVGSIDINAAVNTYGGALSTTGIDFDNTGGAITTKGGSVTIANTGAVTVGAAINTTGGTGLINFSAPTTVTLKSNLSTDGGNIKVQTGSVIIGANVTLDTESGNNSDSGDILLVERNISANAVGYDLTLDTRTGAGYASGDISIGSIDNTAGAFLNDVNITAIGGSADPFTNCGTITLDGNVSVDEDVSGKPGSVAINAKVRMTDSVTIDTEQGGDDNAGVIDMPYANIAAATDNAYDLTLDTSTAGGIGGQLTWYKCGHFEGSGSAYYVRNLTVTSAGSVSAGAISLTGGATTTGTQLFTAGTGGSVTLYGNLEAVNNNLTFAANTPVILANAATIKTGTGTLTFNSSLSSGNNDVTLAGNAIDLLGGAGSVSGTASISLAPASADKSIGISGGAGDLQLSAADIAALADGFSGIFIGRTDGGAAIRIGAAGITFNDPVTFRAPGVGGSIVVNGPITGLGNASMTLNSRGAPTLSGALSTNNSPISINVTSGNITVSDTA